MNLFDYLTLRKEQKDRKKAFILKGEINGLKDTIKSYQHAGQSLLLSNHTEVAEFQKEMHKKQALLDCLEESK
tara:strand:- start:4344 stop:4562 length:219 start_codon:yes stop_codon:yes gene_type:complete